MLCSMNLQERAVAVMVAVRESWLSSVTPRLLAVWVGANTELSKVIVSSWVGERFPGRKSSSVLSRFISGGVWTSTERCRSDRQRFVLLPKSDQFIFESKWLLVTEAYKLTYIRGELTLSSFHSIHVSLDCKFSWTMKISHVLFTVGNNLCEHKKKYRQGSIRNQLQPWSPVTGSAQWDV